MASFKVILDLKTMIGELETTLREMKEQLKSIEQESLKNTVINPHYKRIFSELEGKIEEGLSILTLTDKPHVPVRIWCTDKETDNKKICADTTVFNEFMKFYGNKYIFTEIKATNSSCYSRNGKSCHDRYCDCGDVDYLYGYNVSPKNN